MKHVVKQFYTNCPKIDGNRLTQAYCFACEYWDKHQPFFDRPKDVIWCTYEAKNAVKKVGGVYTNEKRAADT
jgi:hypothetical protein